MKYPYLFLVLVLSLVSSLGAQPGGIAYVNVDVNYSDLPTCFTPDSDRPIDPAFLQPVPENVTPCFTQFFEVDYSIIQNLGLADAQILIEQEIEYSRLLWAAKGMTMIPTVHYWTTPSPYMGNSTGDYLFSFWLNHLPSTADINQLLIWQGGGGIAYVDVLGTNNNVCVSGIYNSPTPWINYGWNANVITHEAGHCVGSPHTHSCTWPGGAIDSCPGFTEGNCALPGLPGNGGTVMSYCHLSSVGINFENSFHPTVETLLKNKLIAHGSDCTPPPPPPSDCEDNRIYVAVNTDAYPDETSFEIIDESAVVVASGGPWERDSAFTEIQDSFCLENGCYRFVITDENGLSGGPCGDGSFILSNGADLVYSGSDFIGTSEFTFCFGDDLECTLPTFDGLESYANQDVSQDYTVEDGVLSLFGNTWPVKEYVYELTASTVLNVDLKVDIEGEIHGIGLVQTADYLQPQFTFRLAGTQNWWGIDLMDDDSPAIGEWVSFEIPIGQVMAAEGHLGVFTHLLFVNDHDAPPSNAASHFRNVELCEYTDAGIAAITVPQYKIDRTYDPGKTLAPSLEKSQQRKVIWPNPVKDLLHLPGKHRYTITNALGNLVATGEDEIVNVSELPSGVYLISYDGQTHRIVKQ